MTLHDIADQLRRDLKRLRFSLPVTHVYNPLEYAAPTYRCYLNRYGRSTRQIVLIGMNPGPWGMAQTGVPFGEVGAVRDWLRIDGRIGRPTHQHPKRPVMGLACGRSEV